MYGLLGSARDLSHRTYFPDSSKAPAVRRRAGQFLAGRFVRCALGYSSSRRPVSRRPALPWPWPGG